MMSPWSGSQMPEMVLIKVDLPAPLSPTMAVTAPVGISRSISASACTGPKLLPTPRSWRSGPSFVLLPDACKSAAGEDARPAEAGRAPSAAPRIVIRNVRCGTHGGLLSRCDSIRRTCSRVRARTQLASRHEVVLDDRRSHVRRRNPQRCQEDRGNGGLRLRICHRAVREGARRGCPSAHVDGQGGSGLRFKVDRLVYGAALVTGEYVLQPDERRVLPGGGERLSLDAQGLQVMNDRSGVLVVGHEHGVDVLVRRELLLELGLGGGRVPRAC